MVELSPSTVNINVRFWTSPRQHEALVTMSDVIIAVKSALDVVGIELPSDVIVLQATPSFRAAIQGDAMPTPGGGVKTS